MTSPCRRLVSLALANAALALLHAALAAPAAAKEILVDCTKASIQDALGDKAADLTIVVKGWCNEHVIIRRPVILRGFSGDPSLDGVEGPGAGADIALVHVHDVPTAAHAAPTPEGQLVYLQDLGIRDSERVGLFTAHAPRPPIPTATASSATATSSATAPRRSWATPRSRARSRGSRTARSPSTR